MRLLIQGGRVLDPASGTDKVANVVIENGKIAEVGETAGNVGSFDETIDATGLAVAPGLIDIHVHFREPGFEYKEDIASGSAAAVAGGFTSVACMPNTEPIIDTRSVVDEIKQRAAEVGLCDVYPIAAITKGQNGKELTEMADLKAAGAVAVSDDGKWVDHADIMRLALMYAKQFGLPVLGHEEEKELTAGGVMNLGEVSTRLGLPGIPHAAEDVAIARDIILAEMTGAHLHICHIATAGGVDLVRWAKQRGVRVTAEVAPHHFTLTDEAVAASGYDTNTKMAPPLRTQADIDAVIAGLKDGTIDCIATDHAPHHADEKKKEYNYAPFGITGLETALGLTLGQLVKPGHLSLADAIGKLTYQAADILGLPKGRLTPGAQADLVIFDPDAAYAYDVSTSRSRSRNTPFDGFPMVGRVRQTIFKGKVVFAAE